MKCNVMFCSNEMQCNVFVVMKCSVMFCSNEMQCNVL